MSRTIREVALSVKRLQHRHHVALNAALAELGVSLVQWDALRHLEQHPGASLHDLAQLTFQTDQSFGALASRMIERGLIERLPGPGRAIKHRLTAHGQSVKQAGDSIVNGVIERSFAALSPEQLAQFGDLLALILETPLEPKS